MPCHAHRVITSDLERSPHHTESVVQLNDSTWPEFLLHGDVRSWSALYARFAEFQILLLEDDELVAAGLTAPFAWDAASPPPATIDEVVYSATWPLPGDRGVLCALAALVSPEHRGKGLSREVLSGMCDLAAAKGLDGVLAPVRPTRKHECPSESMEVYVLRQDESGQPWDPWLRVHETMGGRRLEVARRAVTVQGTLNEWEEWTGQKFPHSGLYVIEQALVPVMMDCERDVGTYEEPNVWYFHANRHRRGEQPPAGGDRR
jgi:GNAT superfamily N-acetyltransferase